jgi:NitT/TauT family transport system substrate-binding protein
MAWSLAEVFRLSLFCGKRKMDSFVRKRIHMRSPIFISVVMLLLLASYSRSGSSAGSRSGSFFERRTGMSSAGFSCSDRRTGSRSGFSCSGSREGTDTGVDSVFTIVTLQGPSSMGMIWMIDSLRRATNPSVSVEIVAEPIQVRKRMLEGTADFAVLPLTMAAILYNKGIDYRLLAIPVWGTLYLAGSDPSVTEYHPAEVLSGSGDSNGTVEFSSAQKEKVFVPLVAPGDSGDGWWDQLRGRKVYTMARGMTPDVLFRHLLIHHEIVPDEDIALDYSFPTHLDLANAVAAGRARLAVLSEPQLSLAIHRNPAVRPLVDLNRAWRDMQGAEMAQTAFLVKGSLADANPELVQRMMRTYAASTQRVHRSPGSAAVLMARYGLLPDAAVARQSISRSNLRFVAADTIRETINDYLQVFYDMNPEIIGGSLPNDTFIY